MGASYWCSVMATALFSSTTAAQTFLASQQSGCPDATPEEEKLFRLIPVPTPRIETKGRLQLVGINAHLAAHQQADFAKIPQAWSLLSSRMVQLEGKTNRSSAFTNVGAPNRFSGYEVCFGAGGGNFYFMPAVEVSTTRFVPPGMTVLVLPPQRYAVFSFSGQRADIGNLRYSIAKTFWKTSKYVRADAPNITVYPPGDTGRSETVELQFWIPIKP
ncbi:GyrI-like domain-containing protein [Deinococcus sp. YIM 134068]|uniref:GyrI-like domain-containing protein n=1 Tax=Deinococcus lichenicola TaxID=3118910 RepID=UPI002F925C7F